MSSRWCAFMPSVSGPSVASVHSRAIRSAVFFGFLAVIGLLSMADRAPGLVKGAWGVVRRAGSRIERLVGLDLIDRGDVPFAFDTIGHLLLWSIAGFLAYGAFSRTRSPWFIGVMLLAMSAVVEVGQGVLSSTRRPEWSDLAANAVGVGFGVAVAVCAFTLIGLFGRLTRSLSG